jgi:hypothetical protein
MGATAPCSKLFLGLTPRFLDLASCCLPALTGTVIEIVGPTSAALPSRSDGRAPVIDGRLGDAVWAGRQAAGVHSAERTGAHATRRTVRFWWIAGNLIGTFLRS